MSSAYLVMEFNCHYKEPKLLSVQIVETPANKMEHKRSDCFYAQLDEVRADSYLEAKALLIAMCYAVPRLAWTLRWLEDDGRLRVAEAPEVLLAKCNKGHRWDITLTKVKSRSRRNPQKLMTGFTVRPEECPTCGKSFVRIDDPKKVRD